MQHAINKELHEIGPNVQTQLPKKTNFTPAS